VILLSDLFPPPQNRFQVSMYTLAYLHSLQQRQDTCSQLSWYLAERVVDMYLRSEPAVKQSFKGRKDWKESHERATARLVFKLTPMMCVSLYVRLRGF